MKKQITRDCIMPMPVYEKVRQERRQQVIEIKKNRRMALGPEAMVFFENYETLLWQVHEMLYIEQGGEEQLIDELLAYNPLVPNGQELVTTFMIEIDDPDRRARILAQLGGVEESLQLRFSDHIVKAQPEGDLDRTRDDGKTSAVHFLHWPMTAAQIAEFCKPKQDIILECTHPLYPHKAILPEQVRLALVGDFSHDSLNKKGSS